jgi:hypothetical protein
LRALGNVSHHIYAEHVAELEPLIYASNIFDEKIVVTCIQLGDNAATKDELKRLLPEMEVSSTVFIIDEPFADAYLVKHLEKVSKKTL